MLTRRNSEWLQIIGRLRSGVSRAEAQAQLKVPFEVDAAETLERLSSRPGRPVTSAERAALLGRSLELLPGATGGSELRPRYTRPLAILMVVVGIVLLIACANVANLLLARATSRNREIAVRMAISAGRRRVVRQLLTESVLLATIGGGLGLAVAAWVSRLLLSYVPDPDVTLHAGLDLRVLTFASVVATTTGLLFGILPALSATRDGTARAIAEGRVGTRPQFRLHDALVVSQVALSVIVLVATGLFLRTLLNLRQLDIGFERNQLMVFELNVPGRYDEERRLAVYRAVIERLEALPQARGASFSMFGMLSNMNFAQMVAVPGYQPDLTRA